MLQRNFFWIFLGLIALAIVFLVVRDIASGDELNDESLGRTLALSLWGLVIAAGIIGMRQRVSAMLRSIALWALIILLLMAGYQYRYELQDIASRVTAGLVPGSPLTVTDADGRITVTLEKLPNGHFEAQASINGQPVRVMIDTGATTTVLTTSDAARAGLDVAALNFNVPVSTANGQALAARVTLDDIAIGAISRGRIPAMVAGEGMLEQSLLGMNFIGTLSGFDIRGDRMILRD